MLSSTFSWLHLHETWAADISFYVTVYCSKNWICIIGWIGLLPLLLQSYWNHKSHPFYSHKSLTNWFWNLVLLSIFAYIYIYIFFCNKRQGNAFEEGRCHSMCLIDSWAGKGSETKYRWIRLPICRFFHLVVLPLLQRQGVVTQCVCCWWWQQHWVVGLKTLDSDFQLLGGHPGLDANLNIIHY